MALRIANKINRQFVRNVCRSLSTKRDVPDLEVTCRGDDSVGESSSVAPSPQTTLPLPSPAYQVCQPRANRSATPMGMHGLQTRASVQNESDAAKNAMAMQHLQPALLPEFFKPPVEINSSIYQEPVNEAEKQSSIKKARRFEESSTRLNLTLPLKAPKLASPFPDPVKVMESHTVSDREKADLMLQEQKMAARTAPPPQASASSHAHQAGVAMASGQRRYYSTSGSSKHRDDKKKDDETPDEEVEPIKCFGRFRLPFCTAPRPPGQCAKQRVAPSQQKKRLAPYPSYSEFCATTPYRKPSECKYCPWKIAEHPTYKMKPTKKRRLHTEIDMGGMLTKGKSKRRLNTLRGIKGQKMTKLNTLPLNEKDSRLSFLQKAVEQESRPLIVPTLECLKEKPPCGPPDHCVDKSQSKDKAKEKPKRKKEECVDKYNHPYIPSKKKTSDLSLGDQIGAWLQVARKKTPLVEAAEAQKVLAAHTKRKPQRDYSYIEDVLLKDDGDCKIKKFPFRESSFPLVKHRKPQPRQRKAGDCPKEPSKKLIKDCPPEPKKDCGSSSRNYANIIAPGGGPSGPMLPPSGGSGGYFMTDKKDDKEPDCKKWKPPKCDIPEEGPILDRCGRGLKPKTWQCPTDLVIRHTPGYREPRKKKEPGVGEAGHPEAIPPPPPKLAASALTPPTFPAIMSLPSFIYYQRGRQRRLKMTIFPYER